VIGAALHIQIGRPCLLVALWRRPVHRLEIRFYCTCEESSRSRGELLRPAPSLSHGTWKWRRAAAPAHLAFAFLLSCAALASCFSSTSPHLQRAWLSPSRVAPCCAMASFQALKQQRARRGAGAASAGQARAAPAPAATPAPADAAPQPACASEEAPVAAQELVAEPDAPEAASTQAFESAATMPQLPACGSRAESTSYRLRGELEVRRTEASGRSIWWAPTSVKSATAGECGAAVHAGGD
jgi:hypothetical protein